MKLETGNWKRTSLVLGACCLVVVAFAGYERPGAGGYGGSIYPPQANLTQWLTTANGTQAVARVGSNANVVGVNCLSFDGVSGYVDTGYLYNSISQTGIFDFSFLCYRTSTAYGMVVASGSIETEYGFFLDYNGGTFRLFIQDGNASRALTALTLAVPSGEWFTYHAWSTDGITAHAEIVGGASTSKAFSHKPNNTTAPTYTVSIGRITSTAGSYYGMLASKVSFDGDAIYPNQEGSGLSYDISGNGNHATANAATWTNDTTGAFSSYNLEDGFVPATVSDGVGNYIDLGVVPTDNTELEIDCVCLDTAGIPMGVSSGGFYYLIGISPSGNFQSTIGDSSIPIASSDSALVRSVVITRNGFLSVNGNEYLGSQETISGLATTAFLFGRQNGAALGNPQALECFSLKWRESGVLVRDMVPFGDGQMLDKVNDVIYSNDGTGTLVTKYIPALSDDSGLAANGLALTNLGKLPHNNCEVSIVLGSTTNTYSMLAAKTNDVDTTRVSIGPNGRIKNIMEYSAAPTGSDLRILNLYLDNVK